MLVSDTNKLTAIAALSLYCSFAASGQTMKVKIIHRQNSETEYRYVVPGEYESLSNTNTNCNADLTDVHCLGTTTTTGTVSSPTEVSFTLTGATLSLQLPDGRVAVVNCEMKGHVKPLILGGTSIRSCRVPLVYEVQTDFKGKNAKLFWPVSVDGKKFESETYKILAILDKKPM